MLVLFITSLSEEDAPATIPTPTQSQRQTRWDLSALEPKLS